MRGEVAGHYARVLLDAAVREGDDQDSLDRLAAGLGEFGGVLTDSPELLTSLTSPALDRQRRARLAQDVGDRILPGSRLGRFAAVMVARERAAQLPEAAVAFRAALDAHRGVVDAEVVSARPLDERARGKLREALAAALGGQPRLHFREDPELLGGFVVRIGNRIYDASVSHQLSRFEAQYGG